ncbi:MAG: hypothetical protein E6J42_03645 [Chloroflexi bacterium]|nr:MAG: hypothetical protein E6J42_03645 [Chloroflexota bacterium]
MAGLHAARSTAHLWIVDPMPEKPWWEGLWPSCHPAVDQRVEMLARMGGGIPQSVLTAASDAGQNFGDQAVAVANAPISRSSDSAPAQRVEARAEAEAFRLIAPETVVYKLPDINSPEIERLPAGALVAVHAPAGNFLQVITPTDAFGFISKLTRMTPYQPEAQSRD